MTEHTLRILQAIKEVVVTVAALVGVIVAWLGLQKWRDELRGRTEFELARRVLVAVYKLRDRLSDLRNPAVGSGEWSGRPGRTGDAGMVASADDMLYAYNNRWRPLTDARSALNAELPEAEAIWGDLLVAPMKALEKPLMTVWFHLFGRYLRGIHNPQFWERLDQDDRDKTEAVVWADYPESEKDEIARDVAAAVKQFEEALRSHLPRRR